MNGRVSRVYATLAAMLFALPVYAAPRVANIHIDNFGRVNDAYYRGGQPQGSDYDDLAALGVKTVIDLTDDDGSPAEKANVERVGMHFYKIPMSTHETPTAAKIGQFLDLVENPANQPVYVHCVGGRHRTGVMTAAYRMTDDGWTADRAFAEMKDYGFGLDFLHPEFKRFVYAYQPIRPAATKVAGTKAVS